MAVCLIGEVWMIVVEPWERSAEPFGSFWDGEKSLWERRWVKDMLYFVGDGDWNR